MTKNDAISLFGSVRGLADALDVTRQAIYQWPDNLNSNYQDRVVGAAIRLGKDVSQFHVASDGDAA